MWIPQKHQAELALEGYNVLKENAMVYIAAEERTGKTLTAILIASLCNNVDSVLVITIKKAKDSWNEALANYKTTKEFTITNYEQAKKFTNSYDLVILDEAHNFITSFPKVSKTYAAVKKVCKDKPIIFLSATPHSQSKSQIFHPLQLSSWSPWKRYKNFYDWFKVYGIPTEIYLNGRVAINYNTTKDDKIDADVGHLFLTKTRKEIGFSQEPKDKLHYIQLSEHTKAVYNEAQETKVIRVGQETIELDSSMKLRMALHMIEGGAIKQTWLEQGNTGEPVKKFRIILLPGKEKIEYILDTWGDTEDLAIMYQYHSDCIKLRQYFSKAKILQATAHAEGISLAHIKNLVIYSQDFRTSKHSQRRARQANIRREDPIVVHFLLVANAISEQVYETVSINKQNFIDKLYQRTRV